MSESKLVTARELAKILKCSDSSISRDLSAGCYPDDAVVMIGKRKRFDAEMIVAAGKMNYNKHKRAPLTVVRRGRRAV